MIASIESLIKILEENEFKNQSDILKLRPDANCVHSDGFYFFDINIHRTLLLIEFEENGEVTIVWAGSHDEYEKTFRNNKNTIKKWLKEREWINKFSKFMKTQSYQKILQKGSISNELELEEALIIDRKLRTLVKENPELAESRTQLRAIIKEYENANWSSDSIITDKKIQESDAAEIFAEQERKFLKKRKEIIKGKLAELGINQQDLGLILGHSKSYISELINGINPFNLKDLIIIHKLFNIKLEDLIPTTIPQKESEKIKSSIIKINKPKLKLGKKDFVLL